jgi:Amt family ammonium transporter
MTFLGWSVFALVYSGFIYAGLTHWTLASGWYFFYIYIFRLKAYGYKDFSGAGVVFYAAGVAGLIITVLLKPRKFRFDLNSNL